MGLPKPQNKEKQMKLKGFTIDVANLVRIVNGQLGTNKPVGAAVDEDGNFHSVFVRTNRNGEMCWTKDGSRLKMNFRPQKSQSAHTPAEKIPEVVDPGTAHTNLPVATAQAGFDDIPF